MDVNARTTLVMGLRTRVLEAGDPSAPAVVMIHGVGGWAENFRAVMGPIAATGRRAIAFDLPGFGESEAPRNVSHFGPRDPFYPRFMIALLDVLDIRAAHIIGNSMGGSIAYMTGVTAPERVRSMTFAAGGGLGSDVALFLRLATLPGMITLSRLLGDRHQGAAVLRTCFFDTSRITAELYDEADRFGYRSFPEFVRALRSGLTLRCGATGSARRRATADRAWSSGAARTRCFPSAISPTRKKSSRRRKSASSNGAATC
jgi:pimeloyl-ACP methyl ester carboxylesterase